MKTREADFVIVGGGTAGCVLAARLSEDPSVSVTVLEAGPHFRGLSIHVPAALGKLYQQGRYHWPYRSQPERYAGGKVLSYKRGRVGGGSSAINGLVWVGCKSRGSTHIASADCKIQPDFSFNFLQDPRDMAVFSEAVRVIRDVVAQAPFDAYRGEELEPGALSSVDDIDTWLRKVASVSHHLVDYCKMGGVGDPLAVVDPDLRVHGLDRLRVIDASIMPTITTGNTHATTIAIAEKGADLIKASSSGQQYGDN